MRYLMLLLLLGGCVKHVPVMLYGDDGATATFTFRTTGTGRGTFRGVMPNGESVQGTYTTVASTSTGVTMIGTVPIVTTASGDQRGIAIGRGDQGLHLECEYVTSEAGHGFGTCIGAGTRYRLTF